MLLATATACAPKEENARVYSLEVDRKYPDSAYLVASAVQDKMHDPQIRASKSYVVGKEKTVYVNNVLLTVSNEREQTISLPYVRPSKNVKLGYEEPKTIRQLEQGVKTNKVKFVELDKNLVYPLQHLKQLPNEFYLPQEELILDKEIEASETKSTPVQPANAAINPVYYVLAGDVYIGVMEDLTLAHVYLSLIHI